MNAKPLILLMCCLSRGLHRLLHECHLSPWLCLCPCHIGSIPQRTVEEEKKIVGAQNTVHSIAL